ncbi:hypothetical protein ACPA9J_16830 [Pseudomonas aeruginosa]
MLQQMIDASQVNVNGVVRLKLYKGNVVVVGRKSDDLAVRRQHRAPSRKTAAPTTRPMPRASSAQRCRMRIAANKRPQRCPSDRAR